jgi:hypothetical protein
MTMMLKVGTDPWQRVYVRLAPDAVVPFTSEGGLRDRVLRAVSKQPG